VPGAGGTWADLGSGTGSFTLALDYLSFYLPAFLPAA